MLRCLPNANTADSKPSVKYVSLGSLLFGTGTCWYRGGIKLPSSAADVTLSNDNRPISGPFNASGIMHASVKQSKIQATASSGNSMSQPTVQSIQFDGQFGFLLFVNSLGSCIVAFGLAFDVEAPTFMPDDDDGPGCELCPDEPDILCDGCDEYG